MDYYVIFGMVAVCLIAMLGFIISIKNETKKEQEVFNKLDIGITKLTTTIDNINADNKRRDLRIDKHGEQIDDIDHRLVVVETKQKDCGYKRVG